MKFWWEYSTLQPKKRIASSAWREKSVDPTNRRINNDDVYNPTSIDVHSL